MEGYLAWLENTPLDQLPPGEEDIRDGGTVQDKYAGMIRTPESWWLCTSRRVFDAWDWPDGPVRDGVLQAATAMGQLYELGPSSMTSAQAMAAARRILGEEATEDDALAGFEPMTQRGRDFMDNAGEFAPDEEG